MAPGRFRRRLSDDHSDVLDPGPASGSGTGSVSTPRSWLAGTLAGHEGSSARARLPWLSPRERRHPLRDVRLSCFRSYLSPGSVANATGIDSDGHLLGGEELPAAGSPQLGVLDKGTESPRPRKGLSIRSAGRSPGRSPGRTRGSKSSENVYFVSPPRAQPDQEQQQQQQQQQQHQQQDGKASSQGVCLGARLRALSARCLALVHADRHLGRHTKTTKKATKQRSFSSGALPGLHDFQRRQLLNPIYRDDHQTDDHTPLSSAPTNDVGEEDGDSGILVSDGAPCSTPLSSLPGCGGRGGRVGDGGRGSLPWGVGSASTAASRALRSASLDRELLGGSPLLDQDEDPQQDAADSLHGTATSQARRSRASTKSSSSSSEISEIFSRFQRRRVASGGGTGGGAGDGSSRPCSPPLLPAPPQRIGSSHGHGRSRRAFHLVRLTRTAPSEELGIFIAKSDAPDRGAQGYVVAHIVPGGLAFRDGQLRLGDELVVVNGRQLRGLSMAAARQRLRAGPTQVDIVIARPSECQCQGRYNGQDSGLDTSGSGDSMTDSQNGQPGCATCCGAPGSTPSASPRTLLESSVDYENVVLRPRDRTPALAAEADVSMAAPAPGGPSSSPTPAPVAAPRGSLSPSPSRSSASSTASSTPSPTPSPLPGQAGQAGKQQLFQKHTASPASHTASSKAARRSLALVSRASSPPMGLTSLSGFAPAETQHHSLKRRAKRHGERHGQGGIGGGTSSSTTADFRVELRKGPGCGALGFTVVGGADSPRGALPIFVRSVLEGGQAAQDGRLQPGDELVLLNGQPLRGSTHSEAVAMFRAVRAGPVVLSVCRRTTKKAQSCSDLVVDQRPAHQEDES